jgi:phage terminase large subunit
MVRDVFGVTPDPWQDDVLEAFPSQPRIAMKACAGPGKTAVLAWLAWNFLLTRPHPKVAATAISGENLKDNLWAEMSKWQQKSPLLMEVFEWQAERIFARAHPTTWWMSARRWSKSATPDQQGNTMRGLHDDYVMVLVDESGGVPQPVMSTIENIGSSAKEWHIVQAGNPTHLEGPLYLACTTARDLWWVIEITADPDDPKRTPRVSAEWARDQIRTYGRDNPWILVNVFGKFPPSSLNTLIGPDEVSEAMKRFYHPDKYEHESKILGVDVGRFGDDPSVIFPRQGIVAFPPRVLRNVNSVQGAGSVARQAIEWGSDGEMIDGTGGYGGGWCDQLRLLGRSPFEVQFSGTAHDRRYFNKRTEMAFDAAAWVRRGGALPPVPELVGEMSVPTYTFKGDQMILEPKDMIKKRLGRSPNHADSFGLTFAEPVFKAALAQLVAQAHAKTEYDPYANA